ncbi:MAG: hypothetical protein L6V83_01155 [Christensenella sp.]|nr:MAG: hypothetical protein L6V83_01155 [Christensenella sp.]
MDERKKILLALQSVSELSNKNERHFSTSLKTQRNLQAKAADARFSKRSGTNTQRSFSNFSIEPTNLRQNLKNEI